jgi:MerR family transcriptional regulator, thiopeptide resistance regulator
MPPRPRPRRPDAHRIPPQRHRLSLGRWFYPCSSAMHEGLADMWEADRRFAANIDQHGAGLTAFLAAAVGANARRRDG